MSAASTTIAYRCWHIPFAVMRGDAWGRAESQRIVAEKGQALVDGAMAWWAAWPALATAAALSREDVTDQVIRGSQVYTAPGYRRVRANARRLAKRR